MKYLSILLFLCLCHVAVSQKFLQIEKLHSPKTRKFSVGTEITFQLKGGQWYTRVLEDINFDKQYMLFSNGHIKVEDITAVKTFKHRKWSRGMSNQLLMFAPIWGTYRGIDTLAFGGDKFGTGDYVIMGSAIGVGLLLRVIFKSRTFNFQKNGKASKRWRLRVLDLDVSRRDFG